MFNVPNLPLRMSVQKNMIVLLLQQCSVCRHVAVVGTGLFFFLQLEVKLSKIVFNCIQQQKRSHKHLEIHMHGKKCFLFNTFIAN